MGHSESLLRCLRFNLSGFNLKSQGNFQFVFPVGEPINAEAWHWYNEVVGEERCTVVDTWWQTGKPSGMILIILRHVDWVPRGRKRNVLRCIFPKMKTTASILKTYFVIPMITIVPSSAKLTKLSEF